MEVCQRVKGSSKKALRGFWEGNHSMSEQFRIGPDRDMCGESAGRKRLLINVFRGI